MGSRSEVISLSHGQHRADHAWIIAACSARLAHISMYISAAVNCLFYFIFFCFFFVLNLFAYINIPKTMKK